MEVVVIPNYLRAINELFSCYVLVVRVLHVLLGCSILQVHGESARQGGRSHPDVLRVLEFTVSSGAGVLVDDICLFEWVSLCWGILHDQIFNFAILVIDEQFKVFVVLPTFHLASNDVLHNLLVGFVCF